MIEPLDVVIGFVVFHSH